MEAMSLKERLEAAVLRGVLGLPGRTRRRLAGRPVVIEGQRLDTEAQLLLRMQKAAPEPAVEDLPIDQGRVVLEHQAVVVGGTQEISAVRELVVAGRDVRHYLPADAPHSGPLLVFFHGGGWIYGSLDSHDAVCRYLARLSGIPIVSVDYRLAPEAPFPAAYDDCLAVYRWIAENPHEFDADPDRLAVGGDSAGGTLAAAVAIAAAREGLPLAFQFLVYPATDMTESMPSRRTYGEGFYLTTAFMDLSSESYLADRSLRTDPIASPLFADLPDGLAPAYVVTAGFDPLRDEGEAYAEKMRAAGVPVELQRVPGQIHGFFNMVGIGRTAQRHVAGMAQRLRAGLTG